MPRVPSPQPWRNLGVRTEGAIAFSGRLESAFDTDEEAYARCPELTGAQWVRLPDDPVTSATSSPTTSLTIFREAIDDVEEVSSEAGEGGTFAVSWSFAPVLDLLGTEDREAAEAQLEGLAEDEVSATLTVSDDGYISEVTIVGASNRRARQFGCGGGSRQALARRRPGGHSDRACGTGVDT